MRNHPLSWAPRCKLMLRPGRRCLLPYICTQKTQYVRTSLARRGLVASFMLSQAAHSSSGRARRSSSSLPAKQETRKSNPGAMTPAAADRSMTVTRGFSVISISFQQRWASRFTRWTSTPTSARSGSTSGACPGPTTACPCSTSRRPLTPPVFAGTRLARRSSAGSAMDITSRETARSSCSTSRPV